MSDDLQRHLRRLWRRSEESLDANTASRLSDIRRRAVARSAAPRGAAPRWSPAGALVGLLAIAVGLSVWWNVEPSDPAAGAMLEDLSLLAADDDLQLFADLEFIEWLDTYGPPS